MHKLLKSYQLIFYGLPGLPMAMLGFPLFVYLPTFYSETLGLSLTSVGLALLFARLFDVVTDPLIGVLNDRLPLKNWRRKSFMIVGVPLLILGLHFLLMPADDVTPLSLFWWSFVTYTGWTLINIPWLTMGAELSPVYHEKSSLASSREIFAVIGTVLVISIPVLFSTQSNTERTLELLNDIVLILLPLTLIPLLFWLPESSDNSLQQRRKKTKELKNVTALIRYPAIKRLLPAYFVNSIANALPATLFILFVTHVLQTPDKIGVLLLTYFLSAIIGLPIWLLIAKKIDKNKSWGIALFVAIASFIWVPFLGENDFYPFLIICILTGFALGADVVFPASIQADISQKIATKENQFERSSGLLFGLWSFLTKLSLALAIGLAFPILDISGFKEGNNHAMGLLVLSLLYGLIPVILKIWVAIQIWNFPFNKDYFIAAKTQQTTGEPHEDSDLSTMAGRVSRQSDYERV